MKQTARNQLQGTTQLSAKKATPTNVSDIAHLLPKTEVTAIENTTPSLDPINAAFFAKYGFTVSDAPVAIQRINERLMRYEAAMGTTVVIHDPREGAEHQMQLFNTFMRALGEQNNDLFMAIDLILARMHLGRDGVYSSRLVYRFIKNIKRDQTEITSYLKILEIFILISDPSQRVSLATSGRIRQAVAIIDPRYRDAAFALVTYLSQYQS